MPLRLYTENWRNYPENSIVFIVESEWHDKCFWIDDDDLIEKHAGRFRSAKIDTFRLFLIEFARLQFLTDGIFFT